MAAVETYLSDLRQVRASGGATGERSSYGPLANLLNAVGATLKPKVFCVGELADQGAGHPDFGLYAAKQVRKGQPREGQTPERGVVEVKSAGDDAWLTADGDQVGRYWARYRLVLVGKDASGRPAKLETFQLTDSSKAFDRLLEKPRAFARKIGTGLSEYLCRSLSHRAALEEALGVRFEGEKGKRFFHSTLVQTLFYGIFSAWVLWARADAKSDAGPLFTGGYGTTPFNWHEAVWHLRAPVLRALFQQLSDPGRLQPLGLVEVLDWTAAALDRVDRPAFFARFNEGEAVPYFYEPFLEAFDPELRKQLGVWYTPAEVVRYMVARVDKALKDDLDIPNGLAAENVYVLDPCCGTGAYLAEVLRRIAANLESRGVGALTGARVKQAATERVFGFEIMPAPFVVAHLQVGLTMQDLGAPLADDGMERASIFLTNALTGWEPRTTKPLPFPELEEERDRAERVKQETPILVILGNPPYNGFAGMAVDEERALSEAYRTTRRVRRPEGQGLNDLYVVHPVNGEVPPVKGRPWKLPHYANRGKTSSSGGELASARSCFSTVRTALGKLRITGLLARFDVARSFPQFPRPLLLQPTIWTSERGADLGSGRCQPRPHLPIYRMTPLCSLLPHGGTAHSREDGPGRGLLHLQLLLAGRVVVYGDAGTLFGSVRRDPHRQIYMAIASSRNMRLMGEPVKQFSRFGDSQRESGSAPASPCFPDREPPPTHRQADASCIVISIRQEPKKDGKLCWKVSTTPESMRVIQPLNPIFGLAYRSSQRRSASIGLTGRRCPTCSLCRFPASRPAATGFSLIPISTGSGHAPPITLTLL